MSRRGLTILVVVLALLSGLYLYLRVQEARAWTAAIDETSEVFEAAMAAYFAGRNEEAARALGAYLTLLESSTPRPPIPGSLRRTPLSTSRGWRWNGP